MKIKKYDNEEMWLEDRKCKITGTKLKNLIVKRGTQNKIGFYELIADRIAKERTEEDPMERGKRLEKEAIEKFTKETGIKMITDLVMWQRDDDDNIASSPDGYTEDLTEALEIKCLSSANHIKAFLTKKIPSEYEEQVIQYFIVNDDLKKLYIGFYDPRIFSKDFFYLEINREDIENKIFEYLELEKQILAEVNRIVNELTF